MDQPHAVLKTFSSLSCPCLKYYFCCIVTQGSNLLCIKRLRTWGMLWDSEKHTLFH